MHRLGSPYGQCMDSTGSMDVQLLYNTSYTRQVSLGVEGGEAGQGPRKGAGEWVRRLRQGDPKGRWRWVGEPASGKEGRQAGQGEGWLRQTPSFGPIVPLGVSGLLLSASDGGDLLLRLLLLPSAGGGRVLQLHAAPSLG